MTDLEALWWAFWIVPPTTPRERRIWRALTYQIDDRAMTARFFHARKGATMARNRKSAKAAGSRFERIVADYLAATVDDRIDRRVKTGAKDRGDIAGVRTPWNDRVVIECKNTTRPDLGGWIAEAETERLNDGAYIGVVAHKRRGKGDAASQYVTMTLETFARLLDGKTEESAL